MKISTLLLGLLISASCFGQNTEKSSSSEPTSNTTKEATSSLPKAQISRTPSGSNYTYDFVSNRVMTTDRAARWEDRFLLQYPDLVSISIDANTQEISMVLPNAHSQSELQEMVVRFGYSGFEIVN
ncbi:MAG: hypothetical protein ACFHU9_06555 [Fluviicola sp.]